MFLGQGRVYWLHWRCGHREPHTLWKGVSGITQSFVYSTFLSYLVKSIMCMLLVVSHLSHLCRFSSRPVDAERVMMHFPLVFPALCALVKMHDEFQFAGMIFGVEWVVSLALTGHASTFEKYLAS